jgi:predicted NBD/HSP70 family sugar kinase
MLVNGQLVHGGDAMAGEFGHVSVDENGPPCPCGNRGCWERYASNTAALDYYRGEDHATRGQGQGSTPPSMPFQDLLRLADTGDARAAEALERMARFIGIGIAGLITGLAPEVIVVIGEVTAAWDRVGPLVETAVKKRTLPHAATRIVPTVPASQPRLRGAVALVVQQHFGALHVA